MSVYTTREERDLAMKALAREYPKAFFIVAERRRPLKLDIKKDIEADLAKANDSPLLDYDIADGLEWYMSHVGYLMACSTPGASRIDLHGKPVGKVTESEARQATEEAEQAFARIEARKKERLPQFVTQTPLPQKPQALPVNANLSSLEILTEIECQVALVRTILGDNPDDLRRELARPALRLMIDELQTIVARLDQNTLSVSP